MSSATSTKSESVHARDSAAGRRASHDPHTAASHSPPATPADDSALRPWQFFLLAGMLCATAVVIVATGQSAASIVILSLTVVAASLVALGAHRALAPLVLPVGALEASTLAGRSRAGLEREKTLVLRTIKELEFDFAMGKISRGDYDEMGGRLRARAIGLIRQLDAGDGYKGAIEQELQIRMGTGGTNQPPLKPAESAEALAKAEVPPSTPVIAHPVLSTIDVSDASITEGSEGATSVAPIPRATASPCVSCGLSNDPDARFCKHCGTKLTA